MRAVWIVGVLVAGPALAQEPQGTFTGSGPHALSATIFATEGAAPFAGRFVVGTQGDAKCYGEFAATGEKVDTNRLEFTGAPEGSKTCKVTVTFTKDFSAALIDEDGCTNYHGASCDFTGAVQKKP